MSDEVESISNLTYQLTEAEALQVLSNMTDHFGWAIATITQRDVGPLWNEHRDQPQLPGMSDPIPEATWFHLVASDEWFDIEVEMTNVGMALADHALHRLKKTLSNKEYEGWE